MKASLRGNNINYLESDEISEDYLDKSKMDVDDLDDFTLDDLDDSTLDDLDDSLMNLSRMRTLTNTTMSTMKVRVSKMLTWPGFREYRNTSLR